jgi:hypothetical protein
MTSFESKLVKISVRFQIKTFETDGQFLIAVSTVFFKSIILPPRTP